MILRPKKRIVEGWLKTFVQYCILVIRAGAGRAANMEIAVFSPGISRRGRHALAKFYKDMPNPAIP